VGTGGPPPGMIASMLAYAAYMNALYAGSNGQTGANQPASGTPAPAPVPPVTTPGGGGDDPNNPGGPQPPRPHPVRQVVVETARELLRAAQDHVFLSLNLSYSKGDPRLPGLKGGGSITGTIDGHGRVYVGIGPHIGVGVEGPGGSLTAGWAFPAHGSTTSDFLSGFGMSLQTTAGPYLAGHAANMSGQAVQFGVTTPGPPSLALGVSGTRQLN